MYPRGQSDEELANNLAQFFINRISKIRTDLDGKNCDYRDHFPLTESVTDFQMLHDFSATCDSELLDIISVHGLKCGLNDPISDKLLKLVIDLFIPLWTQLGNLRLATGSIEGLLKHADIIPLLKAAGLDTETLNNFRPVSVLQFLGKLIKESCSQKIE